MATSGVSDRTSIGGTRISRHDVQCNARQFHIAKLQYSALQCVVQLSAASVARTVIRNLQLPKWGS
jgi:hypothetical protein